MTVSIAVSSVADAAAEDSNRRRGQGRAPRQDSKQRSKRGRRVFGSLLLLAIGGGLVYSWAGLGRPVPLADAVDARRMVFQSQQAGEVSYYVDSAGSGRPLVLIHSVNAAPSAYEMKPLFDYYQGQRPVYALELPGFGFSERSERAYSPQFFADVINEFLQSQVGEAADVVALSLSSEFGARAAMDDPSLFRSLTVITPTGMGPPNSIERETSERILNVVSFPLLGRPLFDLLTSRLSIRYFVAQSFAGEPDQGVIDYAYATSHQEGASIVPFNFLSGKLFSWDAFEAIYEKVTVPTLVIYDQDPNVSFERLPALVEQYDNWQAARVAPTMGLPHWEKLEETVAELDAFWAGE